jgi:predicted phosphodiesterase
VRIQLLSDLHLENDPSFQARPLPGADVLVLAGDIGSYQEGSRLEEDDFGLGRFAPARGWPRHVLYTPGNHEYDGLEFEPARERLKGLCESLGILWLDRTSLVLDGVRFVGTTLWSDFESLSRPQGNSPRALAEHLKQRDKAFRAANFYLEKARMMRGGRPMMAEDVREESLACQAWLRQALAEPFGGPTVCVTHFAPSLRSADPRYGLRPGTAGFCNALDDLLPFARLWLHGHLHCPSDYVSGGCRVVANPLGYAAKGEQEGFRPDLLVDVPGAP